MDGDTGLKKVVGTGRVGIGGSIRRGSVIGNSSAGGGTRIDGRKGGRGVLQN